MKKSLAILGSALPAAMLATTGCYAQPAAQTHSAPHPTTRATAAARGIVVSQARLVLPAVRGNPGAAYFTIRNGTGASATLIHVDVAGALKTGMHETSGGTMKALAQLRIGPGRQVVFAPAGRHVMVFGLTPRLAPGGTGAITLHFQGGNSVTAPLRIEAVGGDMAGMNMSGKP